MIAWTHVNSPVGRLLIAANAEGLWLIEFEHPRHPEPRSADWEQHHSSLLREAHRQLDAYFAGRLREFNLPLATRGTEFQRRVWKRCARCRMAPRGVTRTSHASWASLTRLARSAPLTDGTRFRLSCHVTAWWAPTEA
jgi:O6-methylguanine-DNA--protein-cysteine methyltransferase